MRPRNIGMLLMFCAIAVLGFNIGVTAKNGNNDTFYLLPVGIALLLIGMVLWFRDLKAEKKE